MSDTYKYDFFICHASDDKDAFVRPLAEELRARGFSIWYDEYELTIGDSLRHSIDKGLASSRFGIVVLSRAFFAKEWPQKELDGLDSLSVNGRKVILPIWHAVDQAYVSGYSPILAGTLAISTDEGLSQVVSAIETAYQKGSPEARSSATVLITANGSPEKPLLLLGSLEGQQLEDQVFIDCSRNGAEGILRTITMEFSALKRALVDGRNVAALVGEEAQQALIANPVEILSHSVRNALAVRVGLVGAGLNTLDRELGEDLFDLHTALFARDDVRENVLQMQDAIGAVAYACGAYAIYKNAHVLARSLLGKLNPADAQGGDRPWFRYLQIELGRGVGEMITSTLSVWEDSSYLSDVLGGKEKALSYLCQFDFLQCAHTLASGRHFSECYPSFCGFRRHLVQPVVETLIKTLDEGIWIPSVTGERLAQIIRELEETAGKCAGFERAEWSIDRWSSGEIQLFLLSQEFEVR